MDNQNQICLKTVGELLKETSFFIPSYQRGYRWTKQQVTDLLKDIYEYESASGFYCLQPLVVKNRPDDPSGTGWEVIDGQQRLTTIYIILTCLGISNPYSLEYETRPGSGEFIKNMDEAESESNIDFHYMAQAKKAVEGWIGETKPDKTGFLEKLKGKVKFIWYEFTDEKPITVFTRLNIGKIPLTNSELIKALFLNSSNFTGMSEDSLGLRQREIANEWDEIENTMQDDAFWLFLHKKEYDCPTRIDFIFDQICKLDALKIGNEHIGTDKYRTFRYFYEYFYASGSQRSLEKAEEAWKEIKSYYQTFYEWYDDLEFYHYVGFLIASCGNPDKQVEDLVQAWRGKSSKENFLRHLKDEIKGVIFKDTSSVLERQYEENGSDKRKCLPLLLFHNIQTVINQNHAQQENEKYKISTFYKFPFHLYKLEGWDVEHINSTTSNPEEDEHTREEWLLNVYLSANEGIRKKIDEYFEAKEGDTKREELFKEVRNAFPEPEEWTQEEKNRIGNYALLDSSTNRSYGNAIFSAKRRIIIGKDKGLLISIPKIKDGKIVTDSQEQHATSSFVPPCTKQVFLKYFSPTAGDNNYWTESDAVAYTKDIESCLGKLD